MKVIEKKLADLTGEQIQDGANFWISEMKDFIANTVSVDGAEPVDQSEENIVMANAIIGYLETL